MKRGASLLIIGMLAGCVGSPPSSSPAGSGNAASAAAPPPAMASQIPPVDLGHRPPHTAMTSANMPFFDIVAYCEVTTRKIDTRPRGPVYETCAINQQHYRSIIGQAIDAKQFKEAKVLQCAKASHTGYDGMWYCMNDQPFSENRPPVRTAAAPPRAVPAAPAAGHG